MDEAGVSPPPYVHTWSVGDRAFDPHGRLCEVRHIERIDADHDIFAVKVAPYTRITVIYLDGRGGFGNNLRPEELEFVEA